MKKLFDGMAGVYTLIVLVVVVMTLFVLDKWDEHDAAMASYETMDTKLAEVPAPATKISTDNVVPFRTEDYAVWGLANRLGEATAVFTHDDDQQDIVQTFDYRWAFVNLRTGGSIKIDRADGRAWLCPTPVSVIRPHGKDWCRAEDGPALVPWLMVPSPEAR